MWTTRAWSDLAPFVIVPSHRIGLYGRAMPPSASRLAWCGLRILVGMSVVLVAGCGQEGDDAGDGDADRQAEVAARGAEVMPFDLDATTHRFEPLDDGLLQAVVADDPADGGQIALVRSHLAEEAERFARGDFDDPATIHGDDMPGLAHLRAGFDDVDVTYAETPDGATITYTTARPDLVAALHDWAEAQVGDHGDHAEHSRHVDRARTADD